MPSCTIGGLMRPGREAGRRGRLEGEPAPERHSAQQSTGTTNPESS